MRHLTTQNVLRNLCPFVVIVLVSIGCGNDTGGGTPPDDKDTSVNPDIPNTNECDEQTACDPGKKCVENKCVADPDWCDSDEQCKTGEQCTDNACKAIEGWCEKDADCKETETCKDSKCTPPPPCESDADCAVTETCEEGTCTPIPPCEKNEDCKSDELCTEGVCTPKPPCETDADCAEGERCVEEKCEPKDPCIEDVACAEDEICVDNYCEPKPPCQSDADCEEGETCNPEGKCVPKPPCEGEDCPEGEICVLGTCKTVICTPNESICDESGTVVKCDNFGAGVIEFECPGTFECSKGSCKPPMANVVVVFDTSGSMNKKIGTNPVQAWPTCEPPAAPATKMGISKAAFYQALSQEPESPTRFALMTFPQFQIYKTNPQCKSGYYDDKTKMTGDNDVHETGPTDDWFSQNLKEVVAVPFPTDSASDNLEPVLKWMDGVETIEALPGVTCANCPGFCTSNICYVHTNPELRTNGGTPLGKSIFYAGEYLRRYVLVEGKPCVEKADCGSQHYKCIDNKCHDKAINCRDNVILVFTDGGETKNKSPTDFFNPLNQAKRLHMGLSCLIGTDCAVDSTCNQGICHPAGLDTMTGTILTTDGLGVCSEPYEICNVLTKEGCEAGQCIDPQNTFSDTQGIQVLMGWNDKPLQVRVNVIDASGNSTGTDGATNLGIAFYGGGKYIPVDAESSPELFVEAIIQLVDPKFSVGCL